MSEKIFCKKFKEDLPALKIPPMPGARGQELMATVSQKAWDEWKSHQTTLINEKHLDMSNQESRMWLLGEMEKFFNNEDYEKPAGFKPLS